MKVLTLNNLYPTIRHPRGGIFIDHRLKAQARTGAQSTVVDLGYRVMGIRRGSSRTGALPSSITSAPFDPSITPTEWRRLRNGKASIRFIQHYSRKLTREIADDFDVIHAHGMYSPPAGAIARELSQHLSIPYVVSLHGSDVNMRSPAQGELLAEVLNGAASAIFVSAALRNRALMCGANNREELRVLPNGIDPSIFTPAESDSLGSRTDGHHGDLDSPARVLYVGNLIPIKGADRLPQIFKHIAARTGNTEFVVVGDGTLRREIEHNTAGLKISFLGSVDQRTVARMMAESSLVVLPSRSEGWPTVILEAYACGAPVVASDVGGSSEAVAGFTPTVPDGEDFDRRFAEGCIEALISGPNPADLIEHASKYTWDALAAKELEIFERSLKKDRREA